MNILLAMLGGAIIGWLLHFFFGGDSAGAQFTIRLLSKTIDTNASTIRSQQENIQTLEKIRVTQQGTIDALTETVLEQADYIEAFQRHMEIRTKGGDDLNVER